MNIKQKRFSMHLIVRIKFLETIKFILKGIVCIKYATYKTSGKWLCTFQRILYTHIKGLLRLHISRQHIKKIV